MKASNLKPVCKMIADSITDQLTNADIANGFEAFKLKFTRDIEGALRIAGATQLQSVDCVFDVFELVSGPFSRRAAILAARDTAAYTVQLNAGDPAYGRVIDPAGVPVFSGSDIECRAKAEQLTRQNNSAASLLSLPRFTTKTYSDAGLLREYVACHYGATLTFGGSGGSMNRGLHLVKRIAALTGHTFEDTLTDIRADYAVYAEESERASL